jgi:hypothetical protein
VDLHVPLRTGLDFLDRLQALDTSRRTVVVLLTDDDTLPHGFPSSTGRSMPADS